MLTVPAAKPGSYCHEHIAANNTTSCDALLRGACSVIGAGRYTYNCRRCRLDSRGGEVEVHVRGGGQNHRHQRVQHGGCCSNAESNPASPHTEQSFAAVAKEEGAIPLVAYQPTRFIVSVHVNDVAVFVQFSASADASWLKPCTSAAHSHRTSTPRIVGTNIQKQ